MTNTKRIVICLDGTWQIVEVKSSTRVKADHIHDVAYQLFTLQSAGLGVSNYQLAHINNGYERDGAIDPEWIIEFEDVTDEVFDAAGGLPAAIPIDSLLASAGAGRLNASWRPALPRLPSLSSRSRGCPFAS